MFILWIKCDVALIYTDVFSPPQEALPTVKRKPRLDRTTKLASEITEEDVMRVAEHVSDKKYNFSVSRNCRLIIPFVQSSTDS